MKIISDRLSFWTVLAVMMTAAPAIAAEQTITDLKIEQNRDRLELKLLGTNKANADASFYTVEEGNTITANLLDTDLDLPEGNSFKQENPLPGVKTVEIDRLDDQHTQIVVTTAADASVEHLL